MAKSQFEMLDDVLKSRVKPEVMNQKTSLCLHETCTQEAGASVCTVCGMEVARGCAKEKTRVTLEPGRCQVRKVEEKSIHKDVENMNFSDQIVTIADKIFQDTTEGRILRGNSRRAVIFACVFHAFKLSGSPQSCDSLINMFNLERKAGLKGLKAVGLKAPKDSAIRTSHITAVDLIREIMRQFSATSDQTADVVNIYNRVENCSTILNRSRPQSVASGIVFFYIRSEEKDIRLRDFAGVVKLSELTITKIAKEVARLLSRPEVMA
jgi:hypothetical protein